jgi:hypothetical protein
VSSKALIVRETALSVLINTVLSVLFFLLVFGPSAPVEPAAFGRDFLPQSFMIALMGSLVPTLILGRRTGAAVRPIILRALAFAVGGTFVGGGAFFAISVGFSGSLGPMAGLIIKAIYGGVLAAIVTPLALKGQFELG